MDPPPQPTESLFNLDMHYQPTPRADNVPTGLTPPKDGYSQDTAISDFKKRMLEEIKESFASYMQVTLDDALERVLQNQRPLSTAPVPRDVLFQSLPHSSSTAH